MRCGLPQQALQAVSACLRRWRFWGKSGRLLGLIGCFSEKRWENERRGGGRLVILLLGGWRVWGASCEAHIGRTDRRSGRTTMDNGQQTDNGWIPVFPWMFSIE